MGSFLFGLPQDTDSMYMYKYINEYLRREIDINILFASINRKKSSYNIVLIIKIDNFPL